MKRRVQNLIIELIEAEVNHYQAELEFLKHQLTLPPEHRKVEIEDETQARMTLMHWDGKIHDLSEASLSVRYIKTED